MKLRLLSIVALLCGLLVGLNATLAAEPEPPEDLSISFWEKSQNIISNFWKSSRETLSNVWEHTRQVSGNDEETKDFRRLWDSIVPQLEDILVLEDRKNELPKKAWFSPDQESAQQDINELLDESITILSISPTQRYRERLQELEEKIRTLQEEIADYRTRRISAPKDSLWQKTVAEYDRATYERQIRLQEHLSELATTKREFAGELQRLGLDISDEQLEFLLSTVVGDDLVQMGIAFDNVKAITIQLEQLMVEGGENFHSGRRYYGMYLVLLKILDRMQAHLLTAINERHVPEIDAITNRTRTLMTETHNLQQRASANHQILTANLKAQELTLQAAAFYRDYLITQSRQLQEARQHLAQDIAVAQNTYETVKVSGELVALMRNSQQLLNDLLNRQVPPLRPFENLEMKREFEKLTVQLKTNNAA